MRTGTLGFSTVVFALVLALSLVPVGGWAQTGGGAFAQLSPGNQMIAKALFEAQASSPTALTLDQIAAMKQGHEGWGEVFKQMKAQGLLTEKNLGQVVSSFERHHPEAAKLDKAEREKLEKAVKAEKVERTERVARPERPVRPERPGR